VASRSKDWLRQAERDLEHASNSRAAGHHEWACFASHQAGEKALKAVLQSQGKDAFGHALAVLLAECAAKPPADLMRRAKALDKHYIPARYPNGLPAGAPMDFYTDAEAKKAVTDADAIVRWCQGLLP
jgi:HEPN domain-containing protein